MNELSVEDALIIIGICFIVITLVFFEPPVRELWKKWRNK